ncbi:MAG: FprA family A-type flavoprotein [Clostridia bacterium]|nr:FprA family A-type flavoprotein [Clostridia bacterium]
MRNIIDSIKYIGVNDNDIDLFEGQYIVPNGMTYNSYIILGEKIALMDTVDKSKTNEWISNLEELLDGREPDYLVVSHLEPDHAGSIAEVLNKYKNMKIVLNPIAQRMYSQFFNIDVSDRTELVKDGDILDLGEYKLTFLTASMVHWPEVMFSYEEKTKTLFSADGFGKFGACNIEDELVYNFTGFNQINWAEKWDDEARRYYINICGKYGAQVQAVLKKISKLNLDIKSICPLHGPILTGDLSHYLGLYDKWSKYEPEENGTLIVYGSIHGNTMQVANKLYEAIKLQGSKVEIMDIARCDIPEAIAKAYKYGKLVIASVTYNMSIFPNMYLFVNLLKEKNYQNRKVGIIENGSWAPNTENVIKNILENQKDIEFLKPTISIKSKISEENEKEIVDLAKELVK